MTIEEAIEILKHHNEWRRGANLELKMVNPTELGIAIDIVIANYERKDSEYD